MLNRKGDTPENLWVKCPNCSEMIFHRDMEAALNVCPSCGHHLRLGPEERFAQLFDGAQYQVFDLPEALNDPLKFRDKERYAERLKAHRRKTGQQDTMAGAHGHLGGVDTVVLVHNYSFMGGSMGIAAGEALVRAAELAVARKSPLVVFTASGGARMQEGILSLMQMPRTTLAVEMVKEARLPYIVVLTDPTTGGVTASYAMLGDVHLAEPGALIGFAGPRVIEQTIGEKLPEGFQRSEYLHEKGMVDLVVPRTEMRETLSRLLRVLMKQSAAQVEASAPESNVSVLPVGEAETFTPEQKAAE